jgi:hypothetical protein
VAEDACTETVPGKPMRTMIAHFAKDSRCARKVIAIGLYGKNIAVKTGLDYSSSTFLGQH